MNQGPFSGQRSKGTVPLPTWRTLALRRQHSKYHTPNYSKPCYNVHVMKQNYTTKKPKRTDLQWPRICCRKVAFNRPRMNRDSGQSSRRRQRRRRRPRDHYHCCCCYNLIPFLSSGAHWLLLFWFLCYCQRETVEATRHTATALSTYAYSVILTIAVVVVVRIVTARPSSSAQLFGWSVWGTRTPGELNSN